MQTPNRYRGYDGFGDIWSDIMAPIKSAGSFVEQKILRPVIFKPIGDPLLNELHQVEVHVIDPYLKPLIRPLQKIMPKITIDGHRYDLGGSQLLQKAATGAAAGFAAGGVYGAVFGALAASLQQGKPNVLADLEAGAAAGLAVSAVTSLLSPAVQAADLGNTAAQGLQVLDNTGNTIATVNEYGYAVDNAGNVLGQVDEYGNVIDTAGNAVGTVGGTASGMPITANPITPTPTTPTTPIPPGLTPAQIIGGASTAAGVASKALSLAQQTGLIKPPTPGLTPQQIAAMQTQQAGASSDILPIVAVAAVLGLGIILFTSGD